MSGLTVLVCGGRDFADREFVFRVLDEIHTKTPIARVVHGACGLDAADNFDPDLLKGADRWADQWAYKASCGVRRHPAHWRKFGREAGPRRNMMMIVDQAFWDEPVNLVVAFPGGRGTRNMVARARKAGIEVREVG